MSAAEEKPPTRRRRPGRPRGQDSAVVRDAALRAAIDLIAEHGFAATSMAQIAEAAGISPSGLAHHFPSKNALLGAVLDLRDEMDRLGEDDADGPWEVFDELVRVAEVNGRRRQLVALYMTMIGEASSPGHPAHPWMLRHYEGAMPRLERAVRAGKEQGVIRPEAPTCHPDRALGDPPRAPTCDVTHWSCDPGHIVTGSMTVSRAHRARHHDPTMTTEVPS